MVLLYFGSNGVLNATYTGQIVLVTSLTMLQLVKFDFKAFCVFKKKKNRKLLQYQFGSCITRS